MAWLKTLIEQKRKIGIKAKKTEDDGIYIYRGSSTKMGYIQKAKTRRLVAENELQSLAATDYNPVKGKKSGIRKATKSERFDGKGKIATILRTTVKQDDSAETKFLEELKKHGL